MAGRIIQPGAGPIYRGKQGLSVPGAKRILGFDASLGRAGGSSLPPALSPAYYSTTLPASAGSAASAFINLPVGATITGISPNDGRIVANGAGTQLVVGLAALTLGTYQWDITFGIGAVTQTFQYELKVTRANNSLYTNGIVLSGSQSGFFNRGPDFTTAIMPATGYTILNGAAIGTVVGYAKCGVVSNTITGTITTNTTTSIVGTGTKFTTELAVGGELSFANQTFVVASITDDTHADMTTAAPGTYTAIKAVSRKDIPTWNLSNSDGGNFAIDSATGQITVAKVGIAVGTRTINIRCLRSGYNALFSQAKIVVQPAYNIVNQSTGAISNQFNYAPSFAFLADSIGQFNTAGWVSQGYPFLNKQSGGEVNVAFDLNPNFYFRNWWTGANIMTAGSNPPSFYGMNQGLASDTSTGALTRLNECLAMAPDILAINIGVNETGAAILASDVVTRIATLVDNAHSARPTMPIILCKIRAFGLQRMLQGLVSNVIAINSGIDTIKSTRPWLIICDMFTPTANDPNERDVYYPSWTANPTAGATLTINGNVLTAVASGATAGQFNLGSNLANTLLSLRDALNVQTATYGVNCPIVASAAQLIIQGNSSSALTISASGSMNMVVGTGQHVLANTIAQEKNSQNTSKQGDSIHPAHYGAELGGVALRATLDTIISGSVGNVVTGNAATELYASSGSVFSGTSTSIGATLTGTNGSVSGSLPSGIINTLTAALALDCDVVYSTEADSDASKQAISVNAKNIVVGVTPKTSAPTMTGTVATTFGSTTVTGTGTLFTTEINVGSQITIGGMTRTVVTISSTTSLIVDSGFSATLTGQTATRSLSWSSQVATCLLPSLTSANLALLAGNYYSDMLQVEICGNLGWQEGNVKANATPNIIYTHVAGTKLSGVLSSLTSSGTTATGTTTIGLGVDVGDAIQISSTDDVMQPSGYATPSSAVLSLVATNVSGTVAASGSNALTFTGGTITTDFAVGSYIGVGGTFKKITSIAGSVVTTDPVAGNWGTFSGSTAQKYNQLTYTLLNGAAGLAAASIFNGSSFVTNDNVSLSNTTGSVATRTFYVSTPSGLRAPSTYNATSGTPRSFQAHPGSFSFRFSPQQAADRTLTGTVSTIGTTALVGVSTLFTKELIVGSEITVGGVSKVIATITDDTHATATTSWGTNTTVSATTMTAILRLRRGSFKVWSDPVSTNPGYNSAPDGAIETHYSTLSRGSLVSVWNDNFTTHPVIDNSGSPAAGSYKSQYYFSAAGHDPAYNRILVGNGEVETEVDSAWTSGAVDPFSIDNFGNLLITTDLAPGGPPAWLYPGSTYTSGLLTTEKTFSQARGLFEQRCILSHGNGMWPAIYLLPTLQSSPYNNLGQLPEIDLLENFGKEEFIWSITIHYGTSTGTEKTNFRVALPHDAYTNFHKYAVGVDDSWIVFYLDDNEVARVTNRVPVGKALTIANAGTKMVRGSGDAFGADPLYFLTTTAATLGDFSQAGDAAKTQMPVTFKVDSFKAYTGFAAAA